MDPAELGEYLQWAEVARAKARTERVRSPHLEREERRTPPVEAVAAVEA